MDQKARSKVLIDNDRTRVTEWRFAPGSATGFHRHDFDYVIMPQRTGTLTMVDGAGRESTSQLTDGTPYFRAAGVEHDVINSNDFEFVFVEFEIKYSLRARASYQRSPNASAGADRLAVAVRCCRVIMADGPLTGFGAGWR